MSEEFGKPAYVILARSLMSFSIKLAINHNWLERKDLLVVGVFVHYSSVLPQYGGK